MLIPLWDVVKIRKSLAQKIPHSISKTMDQAIFSNFNYEVGDYLSGNKSEILFTLTDPTALVVHAEVPEDFSDGVKIGAKVNIVPIDDNDSFLKPNYSVDIEIDE